ncbi:MULTISPECIES: stage III sporulation protein AF [Alicyclobacillus]|uniref:Stage III sporulation protein AF n=1 Tax=Alicyclobacillus vulcanalis TaxID=252246 RepID=A0A1N7KNJ3_9BACL|nr:MULTISPECIES: stage III sporulation protein AF [Alicyclobacillus]SIS63182.1 stage III sporulation protein AF [Alicyclobacillus vulcanalis]
MSAFGDWLRQVVGIALIGGIAEMMLPSGGLVRYVRMVVGVALMAALLSPVVPALRGAWADIAASRASNLLFSNASQAAGAQVENRAAQQYAEALHEAEAQDAATYLAEWAEAALPEPLRSEVVKVTVEHPTSADQMTVTVLVRPPGALDAGEIRQTVASALGIPAAQVEVRDEGEAGR